MAFRDGRARVVGRISVDLPVLLLLLSWPGGSLFGSPVDNLRQSYPKLERVAECLPRDWMAPPCAPGQLCRCLAFGTVDALDQQGHGPNQDRTIGQLFAYLEEQLCSESRETETVETYSEWSERRGAQKTSGSSTKSYTTSKIVNLCNVMPVEKDAVLCSANYQGDIFFGETKIVSWTCGMVIEDPRGLFDKAREKRLAYKARLAAGKPRTQLPEIDLDGHYVPLGDDAHPLREGHAGALEPALKVYFDPSVAEGIRRQLDAVFAPLVREVQLSPKYENEAQMVFVSALPPLPPREGDASAGTEPAGAGVDHYQVVLLRLDGEGNLREATFTVVSDNAKRALSQRALERVKAMGGFMLPGTQRIAP